MYPGIHNFSEIGKLNKVLLHRPGKELSLIHISSKRMSIFVSLPPASLSTP